jgi:hypothetical protein
VSSTRPRHRAHINIARQQVQLRAPGFALCGLRTQLTQADTTCDPRCHDSPCPDVLPWRKGCCSGVRHHQPRFVQSGKGEACSPVAVDLPRCADSCLLWHVLPVRLTRQSWVTELKSAKGVSPHMVIALTGNKLDRSDVRTTAAHVWSHVPLFIFSIYIFDNLVLCTGSQGVHRRG